MTLEKICISLELAKRLDELGVKNESYFCWCKLKEDQNWFLSENWQIDDEERFDTISAFSASELGEMLPQMKYTVRLDELGWFVPGHCVAGGSEVTKNFFSKNEANARAKMLIHLIENGLLNLYDIDKNISG